jgi:hypothetical protein
VPTVRRHSCSSLHLGVNPFHLLDTIFADFTQFPIGEVYRRMQVDLWTTFAVSLCRVVSGMKKYWYGSVVKNSEMRFDSGNRNYSWFPCSWAHPPYDARFLSGPERVLRAFFSNAFNCPSARRYWGEFPNVYKKGYIVLWELRPRGVYIAGCLWVPQSTSDAVQYPRRSETKLHRYGSLQIYERRLHCLLALVWRCRFMRLPSICMEVSIT